MLWYCRVLSYSDVVFSVQAIRNILNEFQTVYIELNAQISQQSVNNSAQAQLSIFLSSLKYESWFFLSLPSDQKRRVQLCIAFSSTKLRIPCTANFLKLILFFLQIWKQNMSQNEGYVLSAITFQFHWEQNQKILLLTLLLKITSYVFDYCSIIEEPYPLWKA